MLIEYGDNLNSYEEERNQLLSQYKYSIILEGEFTELENLEKWIKKNIGIEVLESIYYDKIDYDYCFVEYFFSIEKHALETQNVIPKIFSTYANSYPSASICRTNGNKEFINYNANMSNIIIL
ncbi:hypothetical protein [Flavobacterium pedocola]